EALTGLVPELKGYVLTVLDGDFGQSWLRENNLTFTGYSMDVAKNDAGHWTRGGGYAGSMSVPIDRGGGMWPF
ncbi:MAG: hypothetical protein KC656_32170, partial [Myxococcales bacterium]|nr:hypothetical protein [Myxococcales bacterium]